MNLLKHKKEENHRKKKKNRTETSKTSSSDSDTFMKRKKKSKHKHERKKSKKKKKEKKKKKDKKKEGVEVKSNLCQTKEAESCSKSQPAVNGTFYVVYQGQMSQEYHYISSGITNLTIMLLRLVASGGPPHEFSTFSKSLAGSAQSTSPSILSIGDSSSIVQLLKGRTGSFSIPISVVLDSGIFLGSFIGRGCRSNRRGCGDGFLSPPTKKLAQTSLLVTKETSIVVSTFVSWGPTSNF